MNEYLMELLQEIKRLKDQMDNSSLEKKIHQMIMNENAAYTRILINNSNAKNGAFEAKQRELTELVKVNQANINMTVATMLDKMESIFESTKDKKLWRRPMEDWRDGLFAIVLMLLGGMIFEFPRLIDDAKRHRITENDIKFQMMQHYRYKPKTYEFLNDFENHYYAIGKDSAMRLITSIQ